MILIEVINKKSLSYYRIYFARYRLRLIQSCYFWRKNIWFT